MKIQTLSLAVGLLTALPSLAQDAPPAAAPGAAVGAIAFNRSGKILVLELETGAETVLVDNNVYDRPLVWLPGGERLVYWNHDGGAWDLWAVDGASKQGINLTQSANDSRSAAGSPDGKCVAFMRGGAGVWLMDTSGQNQVQLDPRGHRDAPPVWSPSGAQVAFTDLAGNGDGTVSMTSFAIALDGGKAKTVRELGRGEVGFFLDEGRVLLAAVHEGARELVAVDIEHGTRTALTKSAASDRSPVLSPDRARIAWEETSKEGAVLKVMLVDGSKSITLAPMQHCFAAPSFSPDGRFLAYESGADRKSLQVHIVPVAGGPVRVVTERGGNFPVWRQR